MKKLLYFSLFIFAFCACTSTPKTESQAEIKEKSFDELFKAIEPADIPENVFKLVATDNIVITAGTAASGYNSMVASDGGMGILMQKPVTFCGLRGSRYTLELILRDQKYTMCFFEEEYREQFMPFGKISGRDSNKMQETALSAVETPSGRMAFKEAKLIIECDLAQTHTVNPEECYKEKNKTFFEDAFNEVGSYHKIVFGDITNVWVRK